MKIEVIENENLRIDKYLSTKLLEFSRNKIQKLIEEGNVLVNDKVITNSYKVSVGDVISVIDTKSVEDNKELIPCNIPLDIVYEDDDLLVINKKSGMVTHPAPGPDFAAYFRK